MKSDIDVSARLSHGGCPDMLSRAVLAELAPGANMGKHYHPGDAFAYILEGTMLLEIAGKESVTLKAGQSGSLPPRTLHDDKNASQTAPLKFLVFHVAKKGDPLAVPVK